MNATRRTLFALALAGAIVVPRLARAGANETPGENHRPHTYSSYMPVTVEFGPGDDAIFQKYVVGDQHYAQGAAYADNGNDERIGSANLWNFFEFCTNRSADVMLVSSHGYKIDGSTLIESYANTARGLAIRDSVMAYYNTIFAPGSFLTVDNLKRHGIRATQAFYTAYFQTPQAFAWWSTCWSAKLSMTGPAEARCYLGYDAAVLVSKCLCDDEKVLSRMDGQEGQAKRPLGAALASINTLCPDAAKLVATGKLNTVLSPSVLDYEPKGIVCSTVPGFVQFDCSLDTRVAPAAVVSAYGDGFLNAHAWAGNDRVTYVVNPIKPCPTIVYDVHEASTISDADHARLDGNTKPAVNALGPNQDDFVWVTYCPYCPTPWWYSLITTTVNGDDLTAGNDFVVYSPVTNNSGAATTGTVGLHVDGLTLPVETQPLTLAAGESRTLAWVVPIPANALPGQTWATHLVTTPDGGDAYSVDDILVAGVRQHASIQGSPSVSWGANTLTVEIENRSGAPCPITGLSASDDNGWAFGVTPSSLTLAPHGRVTVQLHSTVPPGTPAGPPDACRLIGTGPDGAFTMSLEPLELHSPIDVHLRSLVDCVPGSANAQVQVELVNHGDHDVHVTYSVQSSHGFPVLANLPPTLQPGVPATGSVQLSIPNDPTLVGTTDVVTLQVADDDVLGITTSVNVGISSALEIDLSALAATRLYTGWATPHSFPTQVMVRNHSDMPLSGTLFLSGGVQFTPPGGATLNVPPHGTQGVSMAVRIPAGFPVGDYAVAAQANTPPIGVTQVTNDVRVSAPVLVDLHDKTTWGYGGQPLVISADLINLRTDRSMSGTLHWTDDNGWITGSPTGTYSLAPGQQTAVQITLQPPPMFAMSGRMSPLQVNAVADTDSVALSITMTYDTGVEATTGSSIQAIVIPAGVTDVPGPGGGALRTEFVSVRPNPAGPRAEVTFRLAQAGHASVTVYDAAGRHVATLADGEMKAGEHRVVWNGTTEGGARAPDGVYFLRLQNAEGTRSRKAVLMR